MCARRKQSVIFKIDRTIFVFFAVGVALGYADAVPTWLLDPDLPMIILSVMVVLVLFITLFSLTYGDK